MKPKNTFSKKSQRGATSMQKSAAALGLILTMGAAHAQDIAATGTQAASTDTWNLATWVGGQWSDGLAPSTGKTYSTGAFQIRSANGTFGGDSLRVVSGGSLLLRQGLDVANASVIGTLILDGGTLITGRAATAAQIVQGNLDIASASVIDLSGSSNRKINFQTGNFTGSGDITIQGGTDANDYLQLDSSMAGSHTGDWTINGGRLVVANDNQIDGLARVTLGSATLATFEIRSNQTIGSLSGNGKVETNNASRILTTGGDGTNTTFDGVISEAPGTISLVKEGGGTFTLSNGLNTFTGPITINGGTLEFSGTNLGNKVYGSTQININGASTLIVSGTAANIPIFKAANYTFDSVGGGKIELGAGGNYDAGVANEPFGITTNGGAVNTIKIIGNGVSGANGFNLGGSVATFNVTLGTDPTSDLTVTPIISNNGSILKTGTGRLTLTGANTYGGSTTITGGTLTLGASGVIPDASPVSLGTATLNAATTGTESAGTLDVTGIATINLGTGAQLAFTSGTATWAGSLNITGAFVSGSSLNFGSSSGLSPAQLGAITLNGGGGPFTLDSSGYLVAGGVTGYAAWKLANGTTQTANLDHDNDGVSNGVEFFLGGTANTTGNTNPLPGVTNSAGTLSVTWTKAATYTGTYGTDFVVETSATLSDPWTAAVEGIGAGFVEISGNNVKYTFPAGTKNFARLKVVTTP